MNVYLMVFADAQKKVLGCILVYGSGRSLEESIKRDRVIFYGLLYLFATRLEVKMWTLSERVTS